MSAFGRATAWNFSFDDSRKLVVGSAGDHNETKNKEVLKRHFAGGYGEKQTAGRALKQMKTDKLDEQCVPSSSQINHQRRQQRQGESNAGFSVECLGELEEFMRSPREGVCVFYAHAHVDAKRIILPFSGTRQNYQTFGNFHSLARF